MIDKKSYQPPPTAGAFFMLKEQQPTSESFHTKTIPDPLEGIIEGNNRQERYGSFVKGILTKIWSDDPQSGKYGEYNDDLYRSTRFYRGDISGYTQSSPFGLDPQFLSPAQFETAVNHLQTPNYIRVRSIPPQLLNPAISIVPVGGSCVIETHGMRTITEIQTGIEKDIFLPEYLTDFVRQIIEMAPTITHISGAILGGHNHAVHYIESDMWTQRIEAYGLPREEADILVHQVYERIHQGVTRYAKLINPASSLVPVNFDELFLPEAIQGWFTDIGLSFDPRYRIAEVIYTYDGPKQLALLKRALREKINTDHLEPQEKTAVQQMLSAIYHVRAKQIDHLRWGSIKLPKDVIVGQRSLTREERERFETDYAYRMGITIFQSVYEHHKNNATTSLAVGFADLPSFHNEVQHESRNVGINFKGRVSDPQFFKSVETQLTTPARLHQHNIDNHLTFLRTYTVDSKSARRQLVAEMNNLRNQSSSGPEIQSRIQEIQTSLRENNGPNYFPLHDNPYIHHAMLFLWEPDFISFMQKAVDLQEKRLHKLMDKDESNEQMRILMEKIYPKLAEYINYLYGRVPYPHAIKNTRIL